MVTGTQRLAVSFFALFCVIGALSTPAHSEPHLKVIGWPQTLKVEAQPPEWLGDDPFLGRLACPALTRLNLARGGSEPVLLARAGVTSGEWQFELRPGLRWWNGDAVSVADLEAFLHKHLAEIAKERGAGLWDVPSSTFSTTPKSMVLTVRWDKLPKFGPWILNGVPFFRAVPANRVAPQSSAASAAEQRLSWECAGLYALRPAAAGWEMVPNSGYAGSRRPILSTQTPPEAPSSLPKGSIVFGMARDQKDSNALRKAESDVSCRPTVDLPFVSAIVWNIRKDPMSSTELRRVMTQLTPRGELMRAGSALLGELVSAPIPRIHPGYDPGQRVRQYSVDAATKALNRLGFKRDRADAPRRDRAGQPMKLVIGMDGSGGGLVGKVIADAFALVGIAVEFRVLANSSGSFFTNTETDVDGVITTVQLPWPGSDFLQTFHTKARATGPFLPLNNEQLDRDLEAYALSLTTERPEFSLLRRIHDRLYELEPMTSLFQHRACLRRIGDSGSVARIDPRDPDWMRKLIL